MTTIKDSVIMSARQRDIRRRPEANTSKVRLSKSLAWLLRHNAESEGFTFLEGGYLPVEDVLRHRRFTGFTITDVEEVVRDNDKQRFAIMVGDDGRLLIRANQGHSISNVTVEMEEITSADEVTKVIHGTNFKAWNEIQKTGLSRMKRNHIHFAAGEPGSEGVISGMRACAQVYIYIDLHKAMEDGIKFFRSANNVILSPGDESGVIMPKYFKQVKNVKTNQPLNY